MSFKNVKLQTHQLEGVNDIPHSFAKGIGDKEKVPFERALSYLSDQFSPKRKLYVKCISLEKHEKNLLRQSPIFMTHELVGILTK